MSEFPFGDIDHDYADARRRLEEAMVGERVTQLLETSGPLSIGKLPVVLRHEERVMAEMARDGWPDLKDSIIEGPFTYNSSMDFIDDLRPMDEDGWQFLGSAHFMRMLSKPVIDHREEARSIDDLYGLTPVVHRAHAVAPELFDNLQVVLAKMAERFVFIDDVDHLYDEMIQPHNEQVRNAIYAAYQIMGKLIKVDDNEWMVRELDTTFQEQGAVPIISAHTYLFDGE